MSRYIDKSNRKRTRTYGTAFFISAHHLLTAAHYVPAEHNLEVEITYPGGGTDFSTVEDSMISTIRCTVLARLNTASKDHTNDIAVLDAGSNIRVANPLSLAKAVPPVGAEVDVIAYPNLGLNVGTEWIQRHNVSDVDEVIIGAVRLHPYRKLSISRGPIVSIDDSISYRLSSTVGMSGGCVLYQGHVVAVHQGDAGIADRNSFPRGVHLERVKKLLMIAKLSHLVAK